MTLLHVWYKHRTTQCFEFVANYIHPWQDMQIEKFFIEDLSRSDISLNASFVWSFYQLAEKELLHFTIY